MRNKYHQHHLQQHHEPPQDQQQKQQQQRSKAFLPMLCSSTSRKQVIISHRRCASSSSPSSSITEEPSSPKVGCMGQVKRNNKVVGFPSIISLTHPSITTHLPIKCHHDQNNYTSNSIVKYHKLKKFFSTKSLTTSPTSVIPSAVRTAASGSHKGKHIRNSSGINNNTNNSIVVANNRGTSHHLGKNCRSKVNEESNSCGKKGNDVGCVVNLVELDPPLPVVKKPVQQGNNEENAGSTLWKRRSGGLPLKGLQVQVSHQNHGLIPAKTV